MTLTSNLENAMNWENFQLKEREERRQKNNRGHGMIKIIVKYSGEFYSRLI
jgi:hypothetical protein